MKGWSSEGQKQVGKFEVKKVKNKGAVSENVVRVTISPRSSKDSIIIIQYIKDFPTELKRSDMGDLRSIPIGAIFAMFWS